MTVGQHDRHRLGVLGESISATGAASCRGPRRRTRRAAGGDRVAVGAERAGGERADEHPCWSTQVAVADARPMPGGHHPVPHLSAHSTIGMDGVSLSRGARGRAEQRAAQRRADERAAAQDAKRSCSASGATRPLRQAQASPCILLIVVLVLAVGGGRPDGQQARRPRHRPPPPRTAEPAAATDPFARRGHCHLPRRQVLANIRAFTSATPTTHAAPRRP